MAQLVTIVFLSNEQLKNRVSEKGKAVDPILAPVLKVLYGPDALL